MKKVLVVEDDPVQQKHICTVLAGCGVEVIVASDGKQGLDKAKNEKPDLIFMDIVMPEMDGFSACRQITTDEATKNIPVVLVSSKKEEADKVWAQLQGASAMVSKPFSDEDLLAQINALTQQSGMMDTQQTSIDQESSSEFHQIRHGFEVGSCPLLISEQTRAEVVKSPAICAVPSTPDWFSGFINHRGETVPVYDLNKYLRVLDEEEDAQDWVLLIDDHPNTVGILLKSPPQSVVDPERLDEVAIGLPEIIESTVCHVYSDKKNKWFEVDHRLLFLALKKQF